MLCAAVSLSRPIAARCAVSLKTLERAHRFEVNPLKTTLFSCRTPK
jgi:hypothetical protein